MMADSMAFAFFAKGQPQKISINGVLARKLWQKLQPWVVLFSGSVPREM
jgi:hypothetical protein